MSSPYHHLYDRIATRVNRQCRVEIDADTVEAIVEAHAHAPIREDVELAILDEAEAYGLNA